MILIKSLSDTPKQFRHKITLKKHKNWRRAMKIYYVDFFFILDSMKGSEIDRERERISDIDEGIKIKSYSNSFLWATFLLHFEYFFLFLFLFVCILPSWLHCEKAK